jgi:hypothetical protein
MPGRGKAPLLSHDSLPLNRRVVRLAGTPRTTAVEKLGRFGERQLYQGQTQFP